MSGRLNSAQPYVVGLFRIVLGLLFTCHGAASLFGVLGGAQGTDGGTIEAGTWPGWYAAVIQLVCGALVLLGLATRPAAFLASGSMAFAYFHVHQSHALWPIQNGGEQAALFCWTFLLLVFTGPGALALDNVLRPSRTVRTETEEEDRTTEPVTV
ncbi:MULTISPECIES: DoxX family protein [Streptomyces]|jgi:putative oxidoreductase|uniref:DoxX family protein n=3 Tax=Streptomyces griseoaurantiacus TaxID=68213 RepID=A0A7W2HUX6_9ACTN|nr:MULTISPECIES: DoxX family protein [Streptomyces]EGG49488.1 putative integral membrane protein [Streptomyces griseoaurantiacus M045]MBA5222596.1 DoxX family protein [Streptomyces griseoaurantiacus]MDX3360048.1 DoxX family protein [Streptomyces sp. ME02-6978.2a]NJP71745.1 DoxX family protein [Streptomyces sp. C1-2]SDE35740.1 putative oxidoreductase [Streptomyces jietaisiensis]